MYVEQQSGNISGMGGLDMRKDAEEKEHLRETEGNENP